MASTTLDASWHSILGIESINSTWSILYSPGFALLIGALVAMTIAKLSPKAALKPVGSAVKSTVIALSALIPTLIMVQVFTNSGVNAQGLASMPLYIAETLSASFNSLWLAVAPLLGATGALIAGSATVSTLTMAPVQYSIALESGIPFVMVLAMQMVGASAGNLLAIHNVVSVSVVVGLIHRENTIMRRLFVPSLIYLAITVAIGLGVYWYLN